MKSVSTKKSPQENLHRIALNAPKSSGVYLWSDEAGTIIYVGKAKSLKNRLTSYFAKSKDLKTRILVARARNLEYIQTKTEYEALLLENNLIKKYKPKYNIDLKDGKTYPMLKLTNGDFPALFRTRYIKQDGGKYFGPFPNVAEVDKFLSLIKHTYTLRQCKRLKKRKTPCLYYHIGRCKAPCCGLVSHEEYMKEVDEIALMLDSQHSISIKVLEEKMKQAATKLDFETAGRIRDGIQSVISLHSQNVVEDMDPAARDYISWASEGAMITFAVLKMRGGKLVARDLYRSRTLKEDDEVLPEFLSVYYKNSKNVPPNIFVQHSQNSDLAEKWFVDKLKTKTNIIAINIQKSKTETIAGEPETYYSATEILLSKEDEIQAKKLNLTKGEFRHHLAAMNMAHFNAKEDAVRRVKDKGDYPGLDELQKVLKLSNIPHRIEGFDIAHLGGTFPVASLISFKDGNPDKKNYRIFRLKTTDGIIDDYASMKEAVARRYTRLLNEASELPDLILIDGGIGQVNAAYGILTALNLNIPVIGLAKRNEEIYLPHNNTPVVLPKKSPALRILQRVRDETHRFSNSKNKKIRQKAKLKTEFENLPHIGKKRANVLIKYFKNIENLATAKPEILTRMISISENKAKEVIKVASEFSGINSF
ncbi:MAG: excinuclease ABC subunit C [Treponema sp.]|nr:MAG: excinuclease ABC subunit C [Treponema sp.]